VLDLPMREADVAIRMKEPSQADLVRKRLMTVRMGLYATPEYLEKHGNLETSADISQHRLICQNQSSAQVGSAAVLGKKLMALDPASLLPVNNYFGVLQGVLHNLGIGILPDYVTEEFPQLVEVLPHEDQNEVPVYLAYPEELRHSQRVGAFRDFVQSEIMEHRKHMKALGKL
jgi:DNA-binding transcriptional LysR family regulator